MLKTILTRPGLVLRTVAEPLRLKYLFGLLAPTGFLALLAPEVLFISLPLLLANLLSSFPLQFSGELHVFGAPCGPFRRRRRDRPDAASGIDKALAAWLT